VLKQTKRLWRKLCHKTAWALWGGTYRYIIQILVRQITHIELLRERLISKRSELAQLKNQARAYRKLRVLAKEVVSHGEHVKYVDRVTVKIKIDRGLHDKILSTIESIESKGTWID